MRLLSSYGASSLNKVPQPLVEIAGYTVDEVKSTPFADYMYQDELHEIVETRAGIDDIILVHAWQDTPFLGEF